jgi:hypothetical protein
MFPRARPLLAPTTQATAPGCRTPGLTPGAFAESSTAVICVRGYDRAHRVWHDKAGTLAKYHIAPSDAALYEDDDLIPVCLGGDNARRSITRLSPTPESGVPGRRTCSSGSYAPRFV